MPHAIIVVGNERRFAEEARAFAGYLRERAGCERVSVLEGAYLAPKELEARLRDAIGAIPREEPALIAYFGHGAKGAWSYALEHQKRYLSFGYAELAAELARHHGPLVIVNDCCHAESLAPHLERAGIGPDRCLLISACRADDVIGPGTGKEVAAEWSESRVFETIREQVCEIDMRPYTPPLSVRAGRRWKNARIRLRNMFLSKRASRPTYLFVNSPPNGWAQHRETFKLTGLRWGAELDHHFFPKP